MHLKKFSKISDEESKFFNLLRGGSALIVLMGHIYQLLIQPNFSNSSVTHIVYSASGLAVIIFFYLSGFMIAQSMYRNASNYSFINFDLKKYIYDRILRLYPPLLAATLIVLLVYGLSILFNIKIEPGATGYLSRTGYFLDDGLFASIFFIQNIFRNCLPTPSMNGPLWSLSHEFWFYVLAACAVCAIIYKGKARIASCIVFFVFVTTMFLAGNTVMFFMGFAIWCLGALTALVKQNITVKHPTLYGILSLLFAIFYFYSELSNSQKLLYYAKYIFGLFFFFFVIWYTSSPSKKPYGIIKNAIVESSSFSYTLYVVHWPILMLIYGLFDEYMFASIEVTFIVSLLSFIGTIYLSWIVSNYVENKKFITKKLLARY